MPGDKSTGSVLRQLRRAQGLTLAAVARRVGCAASLISQVESGSRSLQPWLASALDALYLGNGAVTALGARRQAVAADSAGKGGTVVVQMPGEDGSLVMSRRNALLALSLGALGEPFTTSTVARVWGTAETEEALRRLEDRLAGYVRVGRMLPAERISGALLGDAIALERVKQVCPPSWRARVAALQARYAESLSWFGAEAGDTSEALFWADRCAVWAQAAGWPAMVAYTFVRRSMMTLTVSDDAAAAVRQADLATRVPGAPASARALAAKQAAYGYAMAGRAGDSARALDAALHLFGVAAEEDEGPWGGVGQRSVPSDDLHAVFDGTCRVYLGQGDAALELLEPRLERIAGGSARTHAITAARLARAAVDTGDVEDACARVRAAVPRAEAVGSASARAELKRAARGLARWSRHRDVVEVNRFLVDVGMAEPAAAKRRCRAGKASSCTSPGTCVSRGMGSRGMGSRGTR